MKLTPEQLTIVTTAFRIALERLQNTEGANVAQECLIGHGNRPLFIEFGVVPAGDQLSPRPGTSKELG